MISLSVCIVRLFRGRARHFEEIAMSLLLTWVVYV